MAQEENVSNVTQVYQQRKPFDVNRFEKCAKDSTDCQQDILNQIMQNTSNPSSKDRTSFKLMQVGINNQRRGADTLLHSYRIVGNLKSMEQRAVSFQTTMGIKENLAMKQFFQGIEQDKEKIRTSAKHIAINQVKNILESQEATREAISSTVDDDHALEYGKKLNQFEIAVSVQ